MSIELGVPNACLNCHKDKDDKWCMEYLEKRYKEERLGKYRQRFRAAGHAMQGKGSVQELLAAYAGEEIPAWRATLLGLLAQYPLTPEVQAVALGATQDADALVRAAATELLGGDAARKALADKTRCVRLAAGWSLFPNLPAGHPVLQEMAATATHQSDQPTGAMQLAMLATAQGNTAAAEAQYRRAVERDPASAVARMDYAVFLAQQKRPVDALREMLACAAAHPQNAEVQYRLGLILIELRQYRPALRAMQKAAQLDPQHTAAAQALHQLKAFIR
jgi:predicted Zn-dependent protease